jgi:hypothetical protein
VLRASFTFGDRAFPPPPGDRPFPPPHGNRPPAPDAGPPPMPPPHAMRGGHRPEPRSIVVERVALPEGGLPAGWFAPPAVTRPGS